MLDAPPPIFGLSFLKTEPEEVEIIEVDFERGMATVVSPIHPDTVINILRRKNGLPPLTVARRRVLREYLKPLPPASVD